MLFTEYVLQNSVQEAARLVRTGQVSAGDGSIIMSSTDFKDKICEHVSIIIDCAGGVSVYVNNGDTFTGLTASIADPLDGWTPVQWRRLYDGLPAWRATEGSDCHRHL